MPDALVGPVGDKAGTYFYSRVNRRSNPTMTPAATVTAARAGRGRTASSHRRKELRPGSRELSNQTRPM